MLRSEWQKRASKATESGKIIKAEISGLDRKIQPMMERIGRTEKPEMLALYEEQISKLNDRKLLLAEQSSLTGRPQSDFDATLRTVRSFLANPCNLWLSHQTEHQRLVLRLAFTTKLAYSRDEGFRTAETTLPFKMLADICDNKNTMVRRTG